MVMVMSVPRRSSQDGNFYSRWRGGPTLFVLVWIHSDSPLVEFVSMSNNNRMIRVLSLEFPARFVDGLDVCSLILYVEKISEI